MFAVPGWSLSADKLKAETAVHSAGGGGSTAAAAPGDAPKLKSKKRKRSGRTAVTLENVAELWERVIEHGEDGAPEKRDDGSRPRHKKRPKVDKLVQSAQVKAPGERAALVAAAPSEPAQEEAKPRVAEKEKNDRKEKKEKKGKKKKEKEKKRSESGVNGVDVSATSEPRPPPTATVDVVAPTPAAPPKLTPLQASMRSKLVSARFRHLNETLYTRPSAESFRLFAESPEMFSEYHEGFRQQVGVWPENPVDGYIADIRARGAVRPPPLPKDRRPRQNQPQLSDKPQPLPRTDGLCRIADLGCGDGRLGAELLPLSRKLRLEVLSFDLQSPAPHVTAADMAALPLADASVDVAIFCLALMGTNWPAFVEEAYRILHWKGELWVAEIKSRFGTLGGSAGGRSKSGGGGASSTVVEHSVGNRRKNLPAKKKKQGDNDEPDQAEALAVEVDGAEDRRSETDVSAFVDVLKRRGFVLFGIGGEPAPESIDMSNRMFVKMRFVKSATPTVGKGAPSRPLGSGTKGGALSRKRLPESADPCDGKNDAKVLKPCVYKIR